MKNLLIGFILTGITMSSCQGQKVNCNLEKLEASLVKIEKRDQETRNELMPVLAKYQEDGSGKLKLLMLAMKSQRHDEKNQEFIVEMFNKCGWPDSLSKDAHNTIFLVLQHSPDSLMRKFFPEVQHKVALGLLAPDDEAIMFDRLQMHAGLPQRYGSQTFASSDDKNYIWPVEDVENLDAIRAEVGLPNMDAYIKLAKDSTGVKFTWDKSLSIEKAQKMKKNNL